MVFRNSTSRSSGSNGNANNEYTYAADVDGELAQTSMEELVHMLAQSSGPDSPVDGDEKKDVCLLYTSPSPRDRTRSRMPSSA